MTGTGLPLAGVRVVEMTHMVMGPTCGMILAQLGADVIKVEPPAGDKTRSLGGMGTSFFPLFNRGKRSVVLDFAKAEDRETMDRLLASADVFLENFRDGQLEKQGLGVDELRRKYPLLIVAGHKGFLSGPYEHRPALDEVVQMMSGLAAMTGTSEKPQRVGSSANDIMGGMLGVISILAALYQKRSFIGVVTEGHWQSFCREFCLSEFLDDPTLLTTTDRILARSRIIPRVAEVIKGWDATKLSAKLDRLNICFSPINRPEDLFDDPHVLRPGGLVNNVNANGESFRVPALPIEWNGASIGEGLRVPALGADTSAVRAELDGQDFSPTSKTAVRLA